MLLYENNVHPGGFWRACNTPNPEYPSGRTELTRRVENTCVYEAKMAGLPVLRLCTAQTAGYDAALLNVIFTADIKSIRTPVKTAGFCDELKSCQNFFSVKFKPVN